MPYATPEEVRTLTGVKPEWLGYPKDDTDALNSWLEEWIGKAEEQINEYTKDSWTEADLPGTVNTAAINFVGLAIKAARRHRADQVTRVDDLTNAQIRPLAAPDSFLSGAIKADLLPYVKTRKASGTVRVMRVRNKHDLGVIR